MRAIALYGLVGCCALSFIFTAITNTGRAVGLLPTVTPRPPTATPGPTRTPEPTATPVPTRTPRPTATPRPTIDPAPAQTAQAERRQVIATGVAVGAAPCQPGQIKGNISSGIYHAPGQRDYEKTQDNVRCFDSGDDARAAGFRAAER